MLTARPTEIAARGSRWYGAAIVAAIGFAAFLLADGSAHAQSAKLGSPTPIKMLSVPYFSPELIAQDRGFFKKYNLEVEFVKQVAQGTAGIPAIVANHVQTGQGFGAPPIIQALAGGPEVTAIFAGIVSTDGDFRLYALADSGIKTAQDVVGKTVGIHNFGSYADYALRGFVHKSGIGIDQVKRLTVPLPTMCQALLSKQVDIVAMYSLFYIPCVRQNPGKLHLLAKDNEGLPASAFLYSAYVFSNDYIKERPDVVRAFVAALNDATGFVQGNPDAAKEIISKNTGISADLLTVPTFAKGGCVSTKAASDWVKVLTEFDAIKAGSVDSTGWVSNSFNPNCS